MYRKIDEKYCEVVFETDLSHSEWFGYYNYDPMSRDATKLLCNRVNFDARAITSDDTADLGWYDLSTKEWHYIDTTDSFNWPQGAMLQWLPGDGNENKVIYNQSDKTHFHSVIFDLETGSKKIVDFPIYAITPDGKYSISLNYERSYWCRAYHYMPIENKAYDVQVAEDDGIFCVDLESNSVKRIISIDDVIGLDVQVDFSQARHWCEHIMLNREGTQIAFLHRFAYDNVNRYKTRVVVANIDGSNLHVLSDWKNNLYTHLGWGDDEFYIYSITQNALEAAYSNQSLKKTSRLSPFTLVKKFIKKMIPRGLKDSFKKNECGYRLYKLESGRYEYQNTFINEEFPIDGHPTITVDGQYMITDTYPDLNSNHNLLIRNLKNDKVICVATLSAGLKGNPASCDLHPKVCHGEEYVIVDTAYTGKHSMIMLKLNWDVIKTELN